MKIRVALAGVLIAPSLVPTPAGAADIKVGNTMLAWVEQGDSTQTLVTVLPGDESATVVTATMESDAGQEDVVLVESGAWLHGVAELVELPDTETSVTLTLLDSTGKPRGHYGGVIGRDGVLWSTAGSEKLGVVAAQVYSVSGGYQVAIDLSGAETHDIATGTLTLVSSDEVTDCSKETGECTTTGGTTKTETAVAWGDVAQVWAGDLTVLHAGRIDVRVKSLGSGGEKIDRSTVRLGAPWSDGGSRTLWGSVRGRGGKASLSVDEDPLTSLALVRLQGKKGAANSAGLALGIVSEAWSAGEDLPTHAELALDGETLLIPANSYQVTASAALPAISKRILDGHHRWSQAKATPMSGKPVALDLTPRPGFLPAPVCGSGICLAVTQSRADEIALSVTSYGRDALLPKGATVTLTVVNELDEKDVTVEEVVVSFADEVAVVFASEAGLGSDPVGLDISGKVRLLGKANNKGKQKAVAKGGFVGAFSRNRDGDLVIVGSDKRDLFVEGDVLAGASVALELEKDENGNGRIDGPPVVVFRRQGGTIDKVELWLDVDVK